MYGCNIMTPLIGIAGIQGTTYSNPKTICSNSGNRPCPVVNSASTISRIPSMTIGVSYRGTYTFRSMVHVIVQAHVSRKSVVHPSGTCRQRLTSHGTTQAPSAANNSRGNTPDHPVSILMNEFRST